MTKHTRLRTRAAAVLTSVGVVAAGAAVVTASPAAAARTTVTDFGFQTTAFGSRVTAPDVALRSGRTAFSYISCTRLAGRVGRGNAVADVELPDPSNPQISIKGVSSTNNTYRLPRKGVVGTRGVNTIDSVDLSGTGGAHLGLRNLRVVARAEHTPRGWRTATPISWSRLDLTPATGTPLDGAAQQLVDAVNSQVVGQVISVLDTAGPIEIPGLGVISLGWQRHLTRPSFANAGAFALRVKLYGQDGKAGTADDSEVQLGRAWARVNRFVTSGILTGAGYATQISAVGGAVRSGRNPVQPLPCTGTGGKTRTSSLAGVNLGGLDQLVVEGANGRANGLERKDGSATAWTEGSVAKVVIGGATSGLVIDGLVGRANVRQTASGRVFKNARGTSIGTLTLAGKPQSLPAPGQAIEVPGVAKVEFDKVARSRRGISVTAAVVTLLSGDSAGTVIRLGNANTRIKRF